jgi:hypothetical protein
MTTATRCLCDACMVRTLEGIQVLIATGRTALAATALRSMVEQLSANPGLWRGCRRPAVHPKRTVFAQVGRA